MTDDGRSGDASDAGGAEPVQRLARLHAELLDDPTARATVERSDGDAAAVFSALDQVRADLAGAPAQAPPPGLLAGIDRALAAERAPARPSQPTRGRLVLAAALVAVLLAGVAGAAAGLVGTSSTPAPGPPAVQAASPPDVPVVHRDDLPSALRTGLQGGPSGVVGPLTDPARLAGCLAAHGVPPGVSPVGMRRVLVDGSPQVLLVLPTGVAARFRVLVVGDGCSAGIPLTLADSDVGR